MPYTIIRSKKRKRSISLSLSKNYTLRIMVPQRTSLATIQNLVREKESWIEQTYTALQQRKTAPAITFEDECSLPFMGNKLFLSIIANPHEKRSIDFHDNNLRINIGKAFSNPQTQHDHLRATIKKWFQRQALVILQARLADWAGRMNVRYKALKLNNARCLWGSCSHDNVIRINWRIVMAAPEIVDYLLVHELAHINHKHHGAYFWQCVEKFIPDHKRIRHDLKNDGRRFLESFRE